MSDPGDIHSARSPELQALLDEIAAEASREKQLRTSAEDAPVTGAGLPAAAPPIETARPPAAVTHDEPPAVLTHDEPPAVVTYDEPPAVVTQKEPAAAIALVGAAPRRPRRAMALAGGAAAAVVAIVAITIGNGSSPATPPPENQPLTDGDAVIASISSIGSIGSDGRSTDITLTAPMTTAGGRIVARLSSASKATSPLSPAGFTGSSATVTPTSPGRRTSSATAGSTSRTSSVARSAQPRPTRASRPAPGGGDAATVVTGTSRLTGWAPIPSNSNQDTPADQADPTDSVTAPGSTAPDITAPGPPESSAPAQVSVPTPAPAAAAGEPGTVSATSVCIAISLPPVPVAGGLLPTSLTFPCR